MSQVQWFYENNGSRIGPITDDAIRALLQAGQIGRATLVWRTGMNDWVAVESTELAAQLTLATPPPLATARINGVWVWLLACSPLTLLFFDYSHLSPGAMMLWLLSVLLCALDISNIRRAGHKAPTIWWTLFLLGYFVQRSRKLKQHYAPLIVWLVLNMVV